MSEKLETMNNKREKKIAIIGLGYVGLPLAVEFGKKFKCVGYDINEGRVLELKSGHDSTLEVEDGELKAVLSSKDDVRDSGAGLVISSAPDDLIECNVYIVTVPTPTDKNNRPVLTPLKKASQLIGSVKVKGIL